MTKKTNYYLDENNEFVIENYNQAKTFSSFLPAIAGIFGKPMWVYYVNRGQCVSSFGVNNKDYSIMEFVPANRAYRDTARTGFRTFIKVTACNEVAFYEPFQDSLLNENHHINQSLHITSHDFKIKDVNNELGISVEASFCTLPGEEFSGLIKKLEFRNISNEDIKVEVLDGIPILIPYYLSNNDMKNMSNLRQAWMRIEHIDKIPFYKINVIPNDSPETEFVEAGNFYISFTSKTDVSNFSKIIVDPKLIFGHISDFSYPEKFMNEDFLIPPKQANEGFTPCGFSYNEFDMQANEKNTIYTLVGSVENYEKIEVFSREKLCVAYIEEKIKQNKDIIERLKYNIFTSSSSDKFDLYVGQSMLDNILRGGYPIQIGNGKHNYYVYSRKHGDLEREYNFFHVDSTYYSQGNSNYRDVNQNRRSDVRFFPYIQSTNIKNMFNLIQLDAFNPLVLKGSEFKILDKNKADKVIDRYTSLEGKEKLEEFLEDSFTPGKLLAFMENNILVDNKDRHFLLNDLIEIAIKDDISEFTEGYWVDHWTYNSDLIEQFNSIYPDKILKVLLDENDYTYYESDVFVLPRCKKYILTKRGVRQYNALAKSLEKSEIIRTRSENKNKVHTKYGEGEVYKTSLLSKITTLLLNKIASLDPNGVGVEMESDKPGWCDALNGLPGILGSSINITAEIKRLAIIVKDLLRKNNVSGKKSFNVPIEVEQFYNKIKSLLKKDIDDFNYWKQSNIVKESFRESTLFGISGQENKIRISDFIEFLDLIIIKADKGLDKAFNMKEGIHYTYFINEVTKYNLLKDDLGNQLVNKEGFPLAEAVEFTQRPITYFLEGPVHIMRTLTDKNSALEMHNSIKNSGLYDEKQDMYMVNANIMKETKEIGRQNVFPRGWLENESVFLHMQYKYFLELLRSGLYEEFFHYLKNSMVPFLNPEVYGRSILENSSFIVSSSHPDNRIHGTGYVSRLTGATAEILNMWLFMTAGKNPFFLNKNGKLSLEFKPILKEWLFTENRKEVFIFNKHNDYESITLEKNTFAFNFLGNILIVYHNQYRKDTFGDDAAKIYKIIIQGENKTQINGSIITYPYSEQVRDNKIKRIDIFMK